MPKTRDAKGKMNTHSAAVESLAGQGLSVAMEAVWLVVLFALPLAFFPNIFTTFELAKVVIFHGAAVVLLLLWILKYFLTGGDADGRGVEMHHAAGREHGVGQGSSAGEAGSGASRAKHLIFVFLAGFLGFYVLATVFSIAPALSVFGWYPRFQGLLTVFSYVVFGWVIFFELRGSGQKKRLVFALLGGFLLTCGVALLQKFVPGFLQWWNDAEFNGRMYGTMANPNYLATYIVMMLPVAVGKLIINNYELGIDGVSASSGARLGRALGWFGRVFPFVCIVSGLLTLLFTESRAGVLAAFLSVVFFLAVVAFKKRAMKTFAVLCAVPFLAGALVWIILANSQAGWVKNIPFADRLAANPESASSAETRLQIWPAALRQALASPVIGYGPETFAVTFPAFAPSTVNSQEGQGQIADHPHNELLDIAVQIGIPGMVMFLLFIGGLVVGGTRFFLQTRDCFGLKALAMTEADGAESSEDSWLALAFASSLLGLFVANEFGFSVTVHWVMLATFSAVLLNIFRQKNLAAMDTMGTEMRRHRVPLKILQCGLFVLVAALSMGMFWFRDIPMLAADAHMRLGYESILGGDYQTTVQEYKTAASIAPTEAFYALNLAYAQLQRIYNGEKLSAVEVLNALNSASHAARLRGYDGFSLSVANEIQKVL